MYVILEVYAFLAEWNWRACVIVYNMRRWGGQV